MQFDMDRYVEVAFPMHFNQTFTYRWPDNSIEPLGHRVLAPFRNRLLTGYVLEQSSGSQEHKVKDIRDVLDQAPILTDEIIQLIYEMRRIYGVSLGEALQTIVPTGFIKKTKKKIVPSEKDGWPSEMDDQQILEKVRKRKAVDLEAWKKKNSFLVPALRRLQRDGWVHVEALPSRPTKRKNSIEQRAAKLVGQQEVYKLTSEQLSVVNQVNQSVNLGRPNAFLLHGVTGSGKTEVYLQTAQHCLDAGKNVLALVPEISLTPQFLSRFQARFGESVAVFHSQRTDSEKISEWNRILQNKAHVVLGTRSSIFCPLKNIGLIIMDEEHDRSYKQSDGVSYHAKDMAFFRSQKEGATIMLGSATPSVETYQRAIEGTIQLEKLSQRIHRPEMPSVEIIDLTKEKGFGVKTLFSDRLKIEIDHVLNCGRQVILFLNRRGFSTHTHCPQCGTSVECSHCSITMTYHFESRSYHCHYCNYVLKDPEGCSECGNEEILQFGFGTEKVEKEVSFLFPEARVDRIDRDTARKKGVFDQVFSKFENKQIDILIGTQMISKGLDFENVDLVGVLLADQSLQFPDFRSSENTFQLLTQVVGRTGRGSHRGKAILQTFQPNHYAVQASQSQDFESFFSKEIEYRKKSMYPPFSRIVLFEIRGKNQEQATQMSTWLKKQLETVGGSYEILGPGPAPIEKINLNYRIHLLVKSSTTESLEPIKWIYSKSRSAFVERDLHLKMDIDPFDFM